MPLPLKAGYNFNYAHVHRPPCFEMASAEAYTDFYGLSYLISGENLVYSPDGTFIQREGIWILHSKICIAAPPAYPINRVKVF